MKSTPFSVGKQNLQLASFTNDPRRKRKWEPEVAEVETEKLPEQRQEESGSLDLSDVSHPDIFSDIEGPDLSTFSEHQLCAIQHLVNKELSRREEAAATMRRGNAEKAQRLHEESIRFHKESIRRQQQSEDLVKTLRDEAPIVSLTSNAELNLGRNGGDVALGFNIRDNPELSEILVRRRHITEPRYQASCDGNDPSRNVENSTFGVREEWQPLRTPDSSAPGNPQDLLDWASRNSYPTTPRENDSHTFGRPISNASTWSWDELPQALSNMPGFVTSKLVIGADPWTQRGREELRRLARYHRLACHDLAKGLGGLQGQAKILDRPFCDSQNVSQQHSHNDHENARRCKDCRSLAHFLFHPCIWGCWVCDSKEHSAGMCHRIRPGEDGKPISAWGSETWTFGPNSEAWRKIIWPMWQSLNKLANDVPGWVVRNRP